VHVTPTALQVIRALQNREMDERVLDPRPYAQVGESLSDLLAEAYDKIAFLEDQVSSSNRHVLVLNLFFLLLSILNHSLSCLPPRSC
jgi:deoxyxylulose-5-phosphate synthase